MELIDLTIHELHQKLKSGEVSSKEATQTMLARIEAVEPEIGSFITVTPEQALADAAAADQRIASGSMNLLDRDSAGAKGYFPHRGDPHHLRLPHS